MYHAVGDRLARGPGLCARPRHRATAIVTCGLGRRLLALLALGLVAVERIGAQLRAEREVGRLSGFSGAAGKFGEDRRLGRRAAGTLPMAAPPSLTKSCGLSLLALPAPDHDQPGDRQAGRRDDVERAAALAGEPVGRGRALHQVAGRRQRLAGRRRRISARRRRTRRERPWPAAQMGRIRACGHRPWQVPFDERRGCAVMAPVRPLCKARL